MVKIAVLIDSEFEESEYSKPVEAFKEKGYEIINLGLEEKKEVHGKRNKLSVIIDKAVKHVQVDDFDALLIPGGHSPDKLKANKEAVSFVREFFLSKKPVFVICHGPLLLVAADVIKGKKITGYKAIKQDLIDAKATFLDKEVVIDDNLVSSREPKDLWAFINACLKKLAT